MIKGLTDRPAALPEIGAIRKGAEKPEDGKRPGADLKYFRVVFDERETESVAVFQDKYGKQPTEINILFPFNEIERNFEAWRETYGAGALLHRCNGEQVLYEIDPRTGEKLVINGEPFKTCDGKVCKPVGRMKVIIPELARLAYLVVHTTSIHDIINLSRQLEALRMMNGGRLAGIPLKLRRRPVKISTPSGENGKRARREKWLLSVEADPEWVKASLIELKRAALPGNGLELVPYAGPLQAQVTEGPEWDDDVVVAGEEEEAQPHPPVDVEMQQAPLDESAVVEKPAAQQATDNGRNRTRPYDPELTRKKLLVNMGKHEGEKASKTQRGLVVATLNLCFAGEPNADERRHVVLACLFGKESAGDLSDAEVLALLDWLKPAQDSGGAWEPDSMAAKEARRIVDETVKESVT